MNAGPGQGRVAPPEMVRATVSAATPDLLSRIRPPVSFGCRAKARQGADGSWTASVTGPRSAVAALQSAELTVSIATAPPRLVPVAAPPVLRPAGAPVPHPRDAHDYLTVGEVEAKLSQLQAEYPAVTELIELPNATYEGRRSHALRIGTSGDRDPAVLFTACAHAREWGGAEIALGFAEDLLAAYTASQPITYGGSEVSADLVAQIVDDLTVVVFPCVNPDGRAYDQANPEAWWRKNRRPVPGGQTGVDINRNHDWLWDYKTAFSPHTYTSPDDSGDPGSYVATAPASDDPGDDLYHGEAPDSEAETRNIHALFDMFPHTAWYMDIHSYDGDVLFSWSDDNDQSADPSQNFLNPAYNGQRGISGGYGEYLPADEQQLDQLTAQSIVSSMNVTGLPQPFNPGDPAAPRQYYQAFQSCLLWADERYPGQPDHVAYPCSGTVDDWAAARSRVNPARTTVHSFVVEFSFGDVGDNPFHPDWATMQQIVPVVDAGMAALCAAALPQPSGTGGGPGHQLPVNQACVQLSTKIGQLMEQIASAGSGPGPGAGPGAAEQKQELEHSLALLQAQYARQCGQHQQPIRTSPTGTQTSR